MSPNKEDTKNISDIRENNCAKPVPGTEHRSTPSPIDDSKPRKIELNLAGGLGCGLVHMSIIFDEYKLCFCWTD